MKPLLWRIAGCVLCVLPLAVIWWLWGDMIAEFSCFVWVCFGKPLCEFAGYQLACWGVVLATAAFFISGKQCFDKAKRPPR